MVATVFGQAVGAIVQPLPRLLQRLCELPLLHHARNGGITLAACFAGIGCRLPFLLFALVFVDDVDAQIEVVLVHGVTDKRGIDPGKIGKYRE